MTAAASGSGTGVLARVVTEEEGADGVPVVTLDRDEGRINADLTIGTDVRVAKRLQANTRLAWDGVKLHGAGFIVTPAQATQLGLGTVAGLDDHIRPYRNGRDIQQQSRGLLVIDLFGLSEETVRHRFSAVYQHLVLTVRPERDLNNRASYRNNWWIFGEPRRELRPAVAGLSRVVVTVDTAKHRVFSFISSSIIVDDKVVVIASDDAFHLGVLQSHHHVAWMLAQGNWLGVGNDPVYAKTQCFDPYPFPDPTPHQRATIAAIAEELDALRKTRIAAHPHLTLTALYNVLAAIRAGTPLSPADRDIHDAGQVTILRELHDRLDTAVAAAYGWPADLPDADTIARIVALNAERVREEQDGKIRWLRPAFQAPEDTARAARQTSLDVDTDAVAAAAERWPKEEPAQFVVLRAALRQGPVTARDLSRRFKGTPRGDRLPRMLQTLVALGQARALDDGRFAA